MVAAVAAPNTAAPTAFAHTMWLASGLHSQAGSAAVASGANRLSRKRDSSDPDALIPRMPLVPPLERDDFSLNRHPALASCLSMIFSENRCTLFGIML